MNLGEHLAYQHAISALERKVDEFKAENKRLRLAIRKTLTQLDEAGKNNGYPSDVLIASNTLKKALEGEKP